MHKLQILAALLLATALVACGASTGGSPTASDAATAGTAAETAAEATATSTTDATSVAGASGEQELQKVTLGLGFIPNVQFAPFYVAMSKGYYAAEGLEVEISYGGSVNDLLLQVAAGKLPFLMAAGDEILLARSQQIPVKMVFLMYQRVPVAVFSKEAAGISKPEDLRGKTIGLPGRYGATYIGLRGLLHAAGLSEQDVTFSEIGFTQFEAVSTDKVPAAVGYANNEPLRLRETGTEVNVIQVADYIQLVNNGIVVSEAFEKEQPELVRKFVRATRRGLEEVIARPDEAFDLSLKHIPELAADQHPFQRKVLTETIRYWRTPETDREGLGWLNPPAWQATYDFLRTAGILTQETDPSQAYSTEFYK